MGLQKQLKVGDTVSISTPWVCKDYPNCSGKVVGLRFGGAIAIIETTPGVPYRELHNQYLN